MNPEECVETGPETRPTPGIAYAFADNGIELPVLDITHPLFLSSIDEGRLDEVSKASIQKMLGLGAMPDAQKRTYYEQLSKSLVFGYVFVSDPGANFMSGMSTYVYKLGPNLIGGGQDREFDRSASMDIGSVAIRMRIRDLCRLQADALIPQLEPSPQKNLCFINIGGGAASDSTVHATVPALAKATNAGLRCLGVSGLTSLLEKTGWRLERVQEKNPIYAVFALKKDKSLGT
jgi:hypothetical protein